MLSLVCSLCAAPNAILVTLKSDGKMLSICLECFRPELHEIVPPPKISALHTETQHNVMRGIHDLTKNRLLSGEWPHKDE